MDIKEDKQEVLEICLQEMIKCLVASTMASLNIKEGMTEREKVIQAEIDMEAGSAVMLQIVQFYNHVGLPYAKAVQVAKQKMDEMAEEGEEE